MLISIRAVSLLQRGGKNMLISIRADLRDSSSWARIMSFPKRTVFQMNLCN